MENTLDIQITLNDVPSAKLSAEEFIKKYCSNCGTQRCEGVGTEWFEGCMYKELLKTEAQHNDEL